VGFGLSCLGGYFADNTEFDIFALSYYEGEGAENKPFPVA